MNFSRISNKIIVWGIIFLIVFSPIAFGAVHPWAYTLMELTICFLATIWIVRLGIININKTTPASSTKSLPPERGRAGKLVPNLQSSINRFGFVKTPLNIPIVLFIGLVLFQLAPLPPGVIKFLSPNTYELYKTTLPGWPDRAPFSKPDQQTTITNRQLPMTTDKRPVVDTNDKGLVTINKSSIINHQPTIKKWRSISIYKHATRTELYKILAYIGIFFLIVNYNPSTRSRQPVASEHRLRIKNFIIRLIIVMIIVGCFESIYGLLEYLSGHQHIFFRKKVDHLESVTGTYLNRNHFAAYLAIVICMSFGYITYISSTLPLSNVPGWRQKLSRMINMIGTRTALLFFLILIMSAAVILSGSRMGICSLITAIIIMSIMISKGISIKKISLIIVPVCLLAVWIGLNPVIKRFSDTSRNIESKSGRIQVWKDTNNLIKDFPVVGTGLGTYEYAFPKYKTFKLQVLYDYAHNDYLQLMSDTGITGFIIAIAGGAWYLFVVMRIWFKRKDPFVRYITIGCLGGITYIILHSLTDFNLQIPANALQLSIITGIMHKTITQL